MILSDLGGILSSYGGARLDFSRFWPSIYHLCCCISLFCLFEALMHRCRFSCRLFELVHAKPPRLVLLLFRHVEFAARACMQHETARHDQMAGDNTISAEQKVAFHCGIVLSTVFSAGAGMGRIVFAAR